MREISLLVPKIFSAAYIYKAWLSNLSRERSGGAMTRVDEKVSAAYISLMTPAFAKGAGRPTGGSSQTTRAGNFLPPIHHIRPVEIRGAAYISLMTQRSRKSGRTSATLHRYLLWIENARGALQERPDELRDPPHTPGGGERSRRASKDRSEVFREPQPGSFLRRCINTCCESRVREGRFGSG